MVFLLDLQEGSAEEIAALTNRASISGVQPKLFALRDGGSYRPAHTGERSTHIAKLPSGELAEIVEAAVERVLPAAVEAALARHSVPSAA